MPASRRCAAIILHARKMQKPPAAGADAISRRQDSSLILPLRLVIEFDYFSPHVTSCLMMPGEMRAATVDIADDISRAAVIVPDAGEIKGRRRRRERCRRRSDGRCAMLAFPHAVEEPMRAAADFEPRFTSPSAPRRFARASFLMRGDLQKCKDALFEKLAS